MTGQTRARVRHHVSPRRCRATYLTSAVVAAVEPASTYRRVLYTFADVPLNAGGLVVSQVPGAALQEHQRQSQERAFDDGEHAPLHKLSMRAFAARITVAMPEIFGISSRAMHRLIVRCRENLPTFVVCRQVSIGAPRPSPGESEEAPPERWHFDGRGESRTRQTVADLPDQPTQRTSVSDRTDSPKATR
jgi:hypothetical protein